MKKFTLVFIVVCIFIGIVFGRQALEYVRMQTDKISCEKKGFRHLTLTNQKYVCVEKYKDAGVSCQTTRECRGFCFMEKPPPAPDNRGWCSEYDLPKVCYVELQTGLDTKIDYYDEEGLIICPPYRYK